MTLKSSLKGPLMALSTMLFWSTLPIALKQVVVTVDPVTVVWLRFSTAALWMWFFLPHRAEGRFFIPFAVMHGHVQITPSRQGPFNRHLVILLLLTAACGLGGNFVCYNLSLAYLSASACQIVSQAGPMLLMLGSIVLLHEPMHRVQLVGIPTLLLGFGLFFNNHLADICNLSGSYAHGLLIGLIAALVWAIFGIAQKILLRTMAPQRILRMLYTSVAIALTFIATPSRILDVNLAQAFCLAYCCFNTMVAYGSFTQAMACWETPKVSAVLTMVPLATLLFTNFCHMLVPGFFPAEELNLMGYVGACVTVCGAGLIAIGPMILASLGRERA